MDGRVQFPVISFLQKRFTADYVDTITEAGPNLILSDDVNTVLIQSIINRLNISIEKHKSVGIAIVGHHDCAGNPSQKTMQIKHIHKSIQALQKEFVNVETIGLWVDKDWQVLEIINEN
jgi:hypothetical protein